MLKKLIVLFAVLLFANIAFAQNKSFYTSTGASACKATPASRDGGYVGVCPGVGGYKVEFAEDDLRQNIWVVTPAKKKFDLNLWLIFGNFSAVGEKIEWRKKGGVPVAMIIRYNVNDQGDGKPATSYLMVAKISRTGACVTDIVKPGKSQNTLARSLADAAASKPCHAIDN